MATTQKIKTTPNLRSKPHAFGLLANGSCGPWEVAIDEAVTGQNRWRAQIEGPNVSFYFEIPSLDLLGKLCRFIASSPAADNHPPNGSFNRSMTLVVGKQGKTPATLIRDDEYPDRFFLLAGALQYPIVRYAIAGTDVAQLAEALRQVKEDFDDAD